MSSTTPLTQPHLRVIAACAKTLSTTQPFDARVAQVFVSMRTVMSFDEVRLSYWTDFPTRQGMVHVVGGGTWGIVWDDEMVQAELHEKCQQPAGHQHMIQALVFGMICDRIRCKDMLRYVTLIVQDNYQYLIKQAHFLKSPLNSDFV